MTRRSTTGQGWRSMRGGAALASAAWAAAVLAAIATLPVVGQSPSTDGQGAAPIPVAGGVLAVGTYLTRALGPTITFDVGSGWAAAPEDAGIGMALLRTGAAAPALLSFSEFEGLVFQDPCLAATDATVELPRTPEAIAQDLVTDPELVAGVPADVTIAGYAGLTVDVTTLRPTSCEQLTVWLWASQAGGGFVLQEGEEARFILLDVDGRVLVVAIESYPGIDFERFLADAMLVVDTIHIDPSTTSASPPPRPSPAASPQGSPSPAPVASAEPGASAAPETSA